MVRWVGGACEHAMGGVNGNGKGRLLLDSEFDEQDEGGSYLERQGCSSDLP